MNARSKAMKKSWKERRNSPGRELARKRKKPVDPLVVIEHHVVGIKSLMQDFSNVLTSHGVMLRNLGAACNDPSRLLPQAGTAHSVEVSKRLDELRGNTSRAIAAIEGIIKAHVKGYDDKLADLLAKLDAVAEGNIANHNRLNRVEETLKKGKRK